MINIVVQHAELVPGPDGTGLWKIAMDVIHDDGEPERAATIMQADVVEWRVAQYNVDSKTALEMILVEPYARDVNRDVHLAPTRRQARELKLAAITDALDSGTVTWAVGPPGWRVDDTGREPAIADSGDGDPLATILEATPVDEELIAVKREAMDLARERLRRRVTPLLGEPALPAAPLALRRPTAEELRARLMPSLPLEG